MKVIGLISSKKYIVEIDKSEIEKFLNLYYNKMATLRVGDEIDLGKGYDWYYEIRTALAEARTFFSVNVDTINGITRAFTTTSADGEGE